MSEATARQLNKYRRLPYALLELVPHGQAYVLSDVYSFTGERLDCHRTYKSLGDRAGNSRATVARALKAGKTQGLISVDKNKGYVFNCTKIDDSKFMCIFDWVITEEFNVRKTERRRLLSSERSIFGYIYTQCDNAKKSKKYCDVSISELASKLHLSERTVTKRRWSLIRAGLIYCPAAAKGVNRYKKSRYTLNFKLIREHEQKAKAEKKAAAPKPEQQHPKTFKEIERDYQDKRDRAELISERNLIKAREYAPFRLADDTYKYMGISAAFAPFKNPAQLAEFEQRAARANADRLVALREIGLTEKDIEPQYECTLCNDTGQLKNGTRCKCYPRGSPPNGGVVGVGELNTDN